MNKGLGRKNSYIGSKTTLASIGLSTSQSELLFFKIHGNKILTDPDIYL